MIFQEEDEGQWPSYCLLNNKINQVDDDDGVRAYAVVYDIRDNKSEVRMYTKPYIIIQFTRRAYYKNPGSIAFKDGQAILILSLSRLLS